MVDPEARENNEKQLDEIVNDLTGDDAEPIDNVEQPVTIESLQEQLKQANDRVLRAQAELENFRKRARRDLEEQRQYANLPLVSDLIPAFDNLDRAVEAAEQNENATGLLEGVKMVAVQIHSILQQYNCRRVPAVGGEFDPNVHEAIAQEPSEDVPAGNITREVRVGYQLHDRVIRPSQVMVSTGSPQPTTNEDK
ncbi:MAG: nucleotide exchange factor GrpE [Planctomycetaceae bacterium]|nr:nucleotide exchange factor GrpE [Planctomycetales bacterium]MCB9872606.1 nucleotide exchange factor GrpE [Planctomycetaceae bacterium]MCB9939568.1 nucleotide exchange factor GrpE [Planctomycetaceae bacterium]HRX81558.1 nucleotide exchange factor GrpE [Pirellulaceae bacterium]